MPRIRSVKPEFWTDRRLARLSRDARLLYISLWNHADEWGRLHGDARYVKGHCLPYDDDLSLANIDALLDELADAGRVVRYEHEGDPYLYLPKLAGHQRLEPGKAASRIPEPPATGSDNPAPTAPEDAPSEDETARRADLSDVRADQSEQNPDCSAPRAEQSGKIVVQQVAGSRLHVAGSRERGAAPPDPPRVDVETVCTALADAVERNGSKRPTITAKWRTEARLMLDRDERPLAEVLALIEWATSHQFWRSNVMAVPTLREKYDRLRLQRESGGGRAVGDGQASADPSEYLESGPFGAPQVVR